MCVSEYVICMGCCWSAGSEAPLPSSPSCDSARRMQAACLMPGDGARMFALLLLGSAAGSWWKCVGGRDIGARNPAAEDEEEDWWYSNEPGDRAEHEIGVGKPCTDGEGGKLMGLRRTVRAGDTLSSLWWLLLTLALA